MAPGSLLAPLGLLWLAVSGGGAQTIPDVAPPDLVRTVWMMGTSFRVGVVTAEGAPDGHAVAVAEAVIRAAERAEATLSSWRPESELSRASRLRAGERWSPPPALAALFDEVEGWRSRTGGAFEPNLGALVDAWGLREGGRIPTDAAVAEAVEAVRTGVLRRSGETLERTDADTWLDAGGFGKGYALRRAVEAARTLDPTVSLELDFGGQYVRVAEKPPAAPRWVSVADPKARDRVALRLRLPRVPMIAVATSGNSERGLRVAERRIGHLLDPRTGHPAAFDGSVTVIAEDPMVADILSTALFVLGPEAGRTLVAGLSGVDAVWQSTSDGLVTTLPSDAFRVGVAETGSRAGSIPLDGPVHDAGPVH